MLNIVVDGRDLRRDIGEDMTVEEMVKNVAGDLEKGKSIINVKLDGEDVTGRFDQQQDSVSRFDRLEIRTGGTRDVAMAALEGLSEFHGALIREFTRTAEEFRLGGEEKSNRLFVRCLDGLQVLMRSTCTAGNLLRFNAVEIRANDTNLEETTEKINALLDDMIEAQTQRDVILLADLIEYELVPMLEDWGGFMGMMQSTSEDAAS